MSDDVIVMQNGKIVESGKAQEIYHQPKSDYTKELLNAVPKVSLSK
jgi:ABC-type oligopeptide transport system ATPase subunit